MLGKDKHLTLGAAHRTFTTYGWKTGILLYRYQGSSTGEPQFLAIQFGDELILGAVLVRERTSMTTGKSEITLSSLDLLPNLIHGPLAVIIAANYSNVVLFEKPRQLISFKRRNPKVWYDFLTLDSWHQIMSDRFGHSFPRAKRRKTMARYSSLE